MRKRILGLLCFLCALMHTLLVGNEKSLFSLESIAFLCQLSVREILAGHEEPLLLGC